jgi:ABC-2 type transport system permease protein
MATMSISLKSPLSQRNRALLRELIITDFKLRYQGSALGYLWSLLKPLLLFTILYFVFGHLLKIGGDVPHYPIYLLLGVVLWGFFVEATNNGLVSIVSRGDLIRKINFPKYIIVLSGTISALINLGFNLLVVFAFMALAGIPLSVNMLIFPLVVIELYVMALSLAFLLSAAYVRYRDISYIWEVLMQAAFYATPILYPISLVVSRSPQAAKLLLLNPVAQVIQDARYALVTNKTDTALTLTGSIWYAAIPILVVIATGLIAIRFFRKRSPYFAEEI